MKQLFYQSAKMLIILILLTGVVYPTLITIVGHFVFPRQASGSVIKNGEVLVGSELIGQHFTSSKYFWSRPSATLPVSYNAASSSGSNVGPSNPALVKQAKLRETQLKQSDSSNSQLIPIDLITSSGSGLDPHISPEATRYQISRIAKLRGCDRVFLENLVTRFTETRQLGILGESRVNVVKLNLALDSLCPIITKQ